MALLQLGSWLVGQKTDALTTAASVIAFTAACWTGSAAAVRLPVRARPLNLNPARSRPLCPLCLVCAACFSTACSRLPSPLSCTVVGCTVTTVAHVVVLCRAPCSSSSSFPSLPEAVFPCRVPVRHWHSWAGGHHLQLLCSTPSLTLQLRSSRLQLLRILQASGRAPADLVG